MKLEWIKSIPDYEDYFNQEHQMIIDLIGIDNYIKLYEHFGKTGVYFGSTPINSLKKAWAQLHREVDSTDAARILGVSTKTVYNFRQTPGCETMEIEFPEEEDQ